MSENPYPVTNTRPEINAMDVNPISMMFDPVISERVITIAQTLAKGKVSVPEHLRGNIGDCLAIVMQAASWKLNPFAVAQKTHLIHGTLGYEAQLISAVVSSMRIIEGPFAYEYLGDWDKLAVPPIIRKSGKGFEIPTPGWKSEHETGLSVIVSAKIRGDQNVKNHKLTLANVWPRNSTLWATNPRQQASYLATKQWVRLYAPEAILGVYTTDELEQKSERVVHGERVPDETKKSIMDDARKMEKPEFSDAWFKDAIAKATTIQELNRIGEEMHLRGNVGDSLVALWKKRLDEIDSKKQESQTDSDMDLATVPAIEKESNSQPDLSASSQEKPSRKQKAKAETWPQKIDGNLVDKRGVIWDELLHSSGMMCTQEGYWRKRRGISLKLLQELEKNVNQLKTDTGKTEDPPMQERDQTDRPSIENEAQDSFDMFSEKWFNEKISACTKEEDLDEYVDLIGEVNLRSEVRTGLEQKIEAMRAELHEESHELKTSYEL